MSRRVAVTGIGVVAPGGVGVKQFWDLLTSGRTATRAISLFDASGFRSRIAAECDFDPIAAGSARRTLTGSTGMSSSGSSPPLRRSMTPVSTLTGAIPGGSA